MRWIYSITLFKTLLTLLLIGNLLLVLLTSVAGCSSNNPKKKKSFKKRKRSKQVAERVEENPQPQMQIVYANKSAKMTMNFDLNSQDIYLDMTGAPDHKVNLNENEEEGDSYFEEDGQQKPSKKSSRAKKSSGGGGTGDPGSSPEIDNWGDPTPDSTGTAKKEGENPESKKRIQKILSEIRKAQELFYLKKYPEALEMTQQSLEKHKTAEGLALMGSLLYVMGNKEEARKSWKQSLKINPDMPNVINMLEKVDNE